MSMIKAVAAVLVILLGGSFVAGFILGATGIRNDGFVALASLAIIGAIAIPLVSRLIPESDPDLTTSYSMAVSGILVLLSMALAVLGDQEIPWGAVLMSFCIILGLALGWVFVKLGKPAASADPVADQL